VVPVSEQVPGYRLGTARRDLPAALTVAAVAVPSAMAYAEVAGLSPVNGLYALLLPTVVYALLGTSRQLVIGPEGSISRGAPTPARWLVVDGEAITHIDSAGLGAIDELTRDLARQGVTIVVARLKSGMRQRFDEDGVTASIGLARFHPTVRAAVAACRAADRLA
jgi:MFS superfamily sulfate permease-like transporter